MPAVVACPKCKKKYKLPDKMLGKGVKCSECQTQFKTPAPKAKVAATATDPRKAAAAQQAKVARAQQAKELASLGVQGAIQRPPDVFAGSGDGMKGTPDPLSNHMVQDPGFGDGAEQAIAKEVVKQDDPLSSMFANPALAKEEKKRRATGKRRKSGNGFGPQVWLYLLVIFIPLFIASIVLTFTELIAPETNLLITNIIFGLLCFATFAISIWGIIRVYQVSESVVQLLLCIFIPPYMLYFLFVNWKDMKDYGKAAIASIPVICLGLFAVVSAAGMVVKEVVTQV